MKNAHLRFGWLTYVKSTEKTTTSIKLRLDRFIGEVLAMVCSAAGLAYVRSHYPSIRELSRTSESAAAGR